MNEELHALLDEFTEIQYGIEALITVLNAVEVYYDLEYGKEIRNIVNVVMRYLTSLQKDMDELLDKLDGLSIAKNQNE